MMLGHSLSGGISPKLTDLSPDGDETGYGGREIVGVEPLSFTYDYDTMSGVQSS